VVPVFEPLMPLNTTEYTEDVAPSAYLLVGDDHGHRKMGDLQTQRLPPETYPSVRSVPLSGSVIQKMAACATRKKGVQ